SSTRAHVGERGPAALVRCSFDEALFSGGDHKHLVLRLVSCQAASPYRRVDLWTSTVRPSISPSPAWQPEPSTLARAPQPRLQPHARRAMILLCCSSSTK